MKKISIIIPVLNEAEHIQSCLESLESFRSAGHEIIVVDGGSQDSTLIRAGSRVDRLIEGPRGRARQMNTGAAIASGEIFLFLHADTRLPDNALSKLESLFKRHHHVWGRFDVRLSGNHLLLRLIEKTMNIRSRLTGISTGDQAIFVDRVLFTRIGGYDDIDLMEDVSLARKLKRHLLPICLKDKVLTSSRRWEEAGMVKTILKMWWLRLAFFLGTHPSRLRRSYDA